MPDTAASKQASCAFSLKCIFKHADKIPLTPPLFFVAEASCTSFKCLQTCHDSTKQQIEEKAQRMHCVNIETLHQLEDG